MEGTYICDTEAQFKKSDSLRRSHPASKTLQLNCALKGVFSIVMLTTVLQSDQLGGVHCLGWSACPLLWRLCTRLLVTPPTCWQTDCLTAVEC